MIACPAGVPPWPCPYDNDQLAEADAWLAYVRDLRETGQPAVLADHLGCMGAQLRVHQRQLADHLLPALRGMAEALRVVGP